MLDGHLVTSAYFQSEIKHFGKQVELGIIGADVRTLWVHLDCQKMSRFHWNMTPDIHTCMRCSQPIAARDVVQPVFQVTDPQAQNPSDPTDKGIALNERVYFVHADCRNPGLNKKSHHILLTP